MTTGILKSTTAMVLVASLAVAPLPSFAQTAETDEATQEELLRQQLEADAQAAEEQASEEGESALDSAVEAVTGEAPSEEAAPEAAESAPAEEAAPEAAESAPAEEAAPEAAESAPVEEAAPEAAETAPVEEAAPEAAESAPVEEAAPEAAESAPVEEAAPEAAEAAPVEEAAPESAETMFEGDAAAEAEATATSEEAAPEATESATETADTEASSETEAEVTATESDAAAESDATAEADASVEGEALSDDASADAETEAPDASADASADAEADAPETTSEEAESTDAAESEQTADSENVAPMESEEQAEIEAEADADAPAAMAASGGGEGEGEVVEETVTDETARSSDEEFSTDLQGIFSGEQQAQRNDDDDDDNDGLSNFEKAAIVGIGAVAIGSLLRNNETVAANTGDRIIAERDGQYRVIKNDDALLRQPGSDIKTYTYSDGSTRTVVTRTDGTEVETVRAADGRVLRRTRTLPDGGTAVLFDDTAQSQAVEVSQLPQISTRRSVDFNDVQPDQLAETLAAAQAANVNRTFSLSQIRNIDAVRQLVPEINVDSVNFETNSAVIRPEEAEELSALGNAMKQMIDRNPSEVFLIEGHTDAVGNAGFNLALSDRRAESVALALTEYFDVPPENLVVQGYGESDLLVETGDAERANRRAAVRRITPLLDGSNT